MGPDLTNINFFQQELLPGPSTSKDRQRGDNSIKDYRGHPCVYPEGLMVQGADRV